MHKSERESRARRFDTIIFAQLSQNDDKMFAQEFGDVGELGDLSLAATWLTPLGDELGVDEGALDIVQVPTFEPKSKGPSTTMQDLIVRSQGVEELLASHTNSIVAMATKFEEQSTVIAQQQQQMQTLLTMVTKVGQQMIGMQESQTRALNATRDEFQRQLANIETQQQKQGMQQSKATYTATAKRVAVLLHDMFNSGFHGFGMCVTEEKPIKRSRRTVNTVEETYAYINPTSIWAIVCDHSNTYVSLVEIRAALEELQMTKTTRKGIPDEVVETPVFYRKLSRNAKLHGNASVFQRPHPEALKSIYCAVLTQLLANIQACVGTVDRQSEVNIATPWGIHRDFIVTLQSDWRDHCESHGVECNVNDTATRPSTTKKRKARSHDTRSDGKRPRLEHGGKCPRSSKK